MQSSLQQRQYLIVLQELLDEADQLPPQIDYDDFVELGNKFTGPGHEYFKATTFLMFDRWAVSSFPLRMRRHKFHSALPSI